MKLNELELSIIREALTEYKYFLAENCSKKENESDFAKRRNNALEGLRAEIKVKNVNITIN